MVLFVGGDAVMCMYGLCAKQQAAFMAFDETAVPADVYLSYQQFRCAADAEGNI